MRRWIESAPKVEQSRSRVDLINLWLEEINQDSRQDSLHDELVYFDESVFSFMEWMKSKGLL